MCVPVNPSFRPNRTKYLETIKKHAQLVNANDFGWTCNLNVRLLSTYNLEENCDSVTPRPIAAVDEAPPLATLTILSTNSAPLHF